MLNNFEKALENMKEKGYDLFFIHKAELFIGLLYEIKEKHLISHVFEDVWVLLEEEAKRENKIIKDFFSQFEYCPKDYHSLVLSTLFSEVHLIK